MTELPFARYFQTPEHQAFELEGTRGSILLIHGFPGSPAEMRPLGEALNTAGWRVSASLLPGFGPQMDSLFERTMQEWVSAVRTALSALKSRRPVIAIGFSMGAALAMQAVAAEGAEGLVLLAPYWKLTSPAWNLLPLIRRLFPTVRPFRLIKIDFTNLDFQRGMKRFMPEADLSDPSTQSNLRKGMAQFRLSTGIFDEIRKTGLQAGKAAPRLNLPTLVVQGMQDPLVQPAITRRLLARLPGPLTYYEVNAAHDLLQMDKPAWSQVVQAVLQFVNRYGGA